MNIHDIVTKIPPGEYSEASVRKEESIFPENELIVASRDGKIFLIDPNGEDEVEYHTIQDLKDAGIEVVDVSLTTEIITRHHDG